MSARLPVCVATGCWDRSTKQVGAVALCDIHWGTVKAELDKMKPFEAPQVQNIVSIVYYVTFDGGETVKIGASTSPRARFISLRHHYGRSLKLLAAEPGHFKEEKIVQRMFRGQRISLGGGQGGTEFFRMNDRLRDHIESVRRENPTWYELPDQVEEFRGRKPDTLDQGVPSRPPYPSTTICLASLDDVSTVDIRADERRAS